MSHASPRAICRGPPVHPIQVVLEQGTVAAWGFLRCTPAEQDTASPFWGADSCRAPFTPALA